MADDKQKFNYEAVSNILNHISQSIEEIDKSTKNLYQAFIEADAELAGNNTLVLKIKKTVEAEINSLNKVIDTQEQITNAVLAYGKKVDEATADDELAGIDLDD